MTEQEEWGAYDQLIEEFGRMRPLRGKLIVFKKDGAYELDTNFSPARVRKIEPEEQEKKQ